MRSATAWREITRWLGIRQLITLLLTGDRWIITVLSRTHDFSVTSRFYPVCSVLSGLVKWKIPSDYPVTVNKQGVIGPFPPRLTSLTLDADNTTLIQQINLPDTLTHLTVGNIVKIGIGTFINDNKKKWMTAIAALSHLESLRFTSTGVITTIDLALLSSKLTSLAISNLADYPEIVPPLFQVLPTSLTKLRVDYNHGTGLEDAIPTLTNLLALEVPVRVLMNNDVLHHLPPHLQVLALYGTLLDITVDVVNVFPSTITELTINVDIPRADSLAALERLPLRKLNLIASTIVRRNWIPFQISLPRLLSLTLSNFHDITVPASTTSFTVTRWGSSVVSVIHLLPHCQLHQLKIISLEQIDDLENHQSVFATIADCTIERMLSDHLTVVNFLSWMNPAILQSLSLSGSFDLITVLSWISNAPFIHTLTLSSMDIREFGHDRLNTQLHSESFHLPESLTSLTLYNSIEDQINITNLPRQLTTLNIAGVTFDISQLSLCHELVTLAVNSSAVIGEVKDYPYYPWKYQPHIITFITQLPASIRHLKIMRQKLTYPVKNISDVTLDKWLINGTDKFDVRMIVAHIIDSLYPSTRDRK